jgi:hypothetical protein
MRVVSRLAAMISLPPHPIGAAQWRAWASAGWHPLTTNLVVFFVLSLIVFRRNNDFLFYGADGKFEVTLIEQFPHFAPPLIGFTGDFLRGLGNVTFQVNPYWIPAYFLAMSWMGEYSNFALTYAVCAAELFIATYLTARLLDLPPIVGVVAAWLVPLIIMPYFGFGLIPHTAAAFPHYGTVLSVATVLTAVSLVITGRSASTHICSGIILAVGIGYIVAIAPTVLILCVPLPTVIIALSCISSKSRSELARKLLIFGLIGLVCLVAYGPLVAGLLFDTTASFFTSVSIRARSVQEISMLFWSSYPFLNMPRLFVGGGLFGAAIVALGASGRARIVAMGLLIVEAAIVGVGFLHIIRPFWIGPALWYFEGFLFCYLAIFWVAGIYVVARFAFAAMIWLFAANWLHFVAPSLPMRLAGTLIAGLMTAYVLDRGTADTAGPFFIPHPNAETPITRILKDEISLKSERKFRGRVADFIGRSLPEVSDFQVWVFLRHFALSETGNMHYGAGFWQDAIPTLVEYSPQMTAGYFAFMRRFFTRPQDHQTRNRVEMRNIDPRLLMAVGVRFVLTDAPYEGNLVLRSKIPVPVTETLRKEFYAPELFRHHDFALYLYELPKANVGQYSPTESRRAEQAQEILSTLVAPDLDPGRTVITSEILPNDLVPAQLQEFRVGRGNFHVRATSSGRSILLLPVEFSNCLILTNATADVRIFRADLFLTGLIFENTVDLTMRYFTGPFSNSMCRLKDRREFERLDIANAFRDRPEFLP